MKYQAKVRQELNETKLIFRVPGSYKEGYEIRMLKENEVPGLIPVRARGEGETAVYEYDITGMTSLSEVFQTRKMKGTQMAEFIEQMRKLVFEVNRFLLDPNHILIHPAYIFCKDGAYAFCYFPPEQDPLPVTFHKLMDLFEQWTDYQDVVSVKAAFLLHKETMKETYSIQGLAGRLSELLAEEETETEKENSKGELNKEGITSGVVYDDYEHEWIKQQDVGSRIMKETDNLWHPMRRFLNRHKRPKWGDFEGIYVTEQEA